jgi:ferredoxin
MKVKVDLSKCNGEGRCYEIATDVFERGPDGKSVVTVAEIDPQDADRCVQAGSAEMMCPSAAITVETD